jgi:hypothetical protein
MSASRGQALLAPHAGPQDCGELSEDEVAREVPVRVVDRLEVVDQVAEVEDLGEAVGDGQPVDRVLVLGLEAARGVGAEELEHRGADPEQIAAPQGSLGPQAVLVDVGPVGRASSAT